MELQCIHSYTRPFHVVWEIWKLKREKHKRWRKDNHVCAGKVRYGQVQVGGWENIGIWCSLCSTKRSEAKIKGFHLTLSAPSSVHGLCIRYSQYKKLCLIVLNAKYRVQMTVLCNSYHLALVVHPIWDDGYLLLFSLAPGACLRQDQQYA